MSTQNKTPPASERGWHSWHLHLASTARSMHDRVILDVVEPVVDAATPGCFFFIRYWQGGPHVRLRMQGLEPGSARRAESLLRELLPAALELKGDEQPLDPDHFGLQAVSLATAGEQGTPLPVEALRDPGVYRARYEPEFGRYGGAELIPLSERLFGQSSRTVLEILHESPRLWARALSAATAVAAAVLALGNSDIARSFCVGGAAFWRRYCRNLGFPDTVVAQVERSGRQNGQRLATHPELLFEQAEQGPIGAWARAVNEAVPVWRQALPVPGGRASAMSVLTSHVHMLHNRLGLIAHEEMFSYISLGHMLEAIGRPGSEAA
jgi:thiopeptide-type bacteriocin biosynthesis protein